MVPPPSEETDPEPASTDDVLDHERRTLILETLEDTPGLNLSQLSARTSLAAGVLRHHLEPLEEAGLVHRRAGARENELLFFPDGQEHLWEDEQLRILYGHSTTRRVAREITQAPGSSAQDLADAVDLHHVSVRHHLEPLEAAGLVTTTGDERPARYRATKRLERWMEKVGQRLRVVDEADS